MNRHFLVLEYGSELYLNSVELRDKILRKPLGLKFSRADLEAEKDEYHLALVNKTQEGTNRVDAILLLRITDHPDVIKMRQVATRNELQGTGLGTLLVENAEGFAREKGFRQMVLHARETAVPFYLKLGYRITSERFEEVGIPHFRMEKDL